MSVSVNPTASEVALLLIDIQSSVLDNSHTSPPKKVRLAAETAAKMAAILEIPAFASVIPSGLTAPKPVDELEDLTLLPRHFAGAFNQPEIREAVAATGRKVLAIGGIISEIAVLHGALTAIREGYAVHILIDCCGGLSERTEQAAFSQLLAAGATLSSVPSFFTTINQDLASAESKKLLPLLATLMKNA